MLKTDRAGLKAGRHAPGECVSKECISPLFAIKGVLPNSRAELPMEHHLGTESIVTASAFPLRVLEAI